MKFNGDRISLGRMAIMGCINGNYNIWLKISSYVSVKCLSLVGKNTKNENRK
jgi:hypothetical protein